MYAIGPPHPDFLMATTLIPGHSLLGQWPSLKSPSGFFPLFPRATCESHRCTKAVLYDPSRFFPPGLGQFSGDSEVTMGAFHPPDAWIIRFLVLGGDYCCFSTGGKAAVLPTFTSRVGSVKRGRLQMPHWLGQAHFPLSPSHRAREA